MSTPDRRGMLDRADKALSIRRQCMLLGIARSGVYRPPRPANDHDLALMRRIDELFTAWPFLGSRRMTAMLKAEGLQVNRKRVQRLMRKMGIAALGPKPNTTKPAPGHKIYPYLLRNMTIDRFRRGERPKPGNAQSDRVKGECSGRGALRCGNRCH
jgi:putative transposase